MIEVADWVYPKGKVKRAFPVREVIGDRLAHRLYTFISGYVRGLKITDGLTLMELGNYECLKYLIMVGTAIIVNT